MGRSLSLFLIASVLLHVAFAADLFALVSVPRTRARPASIEIVSLNSETHEITGPRSSAFVLENATISSSYQAFSYDMNNTCALLIPSKVGRRNKPAQTPLIWTKNGPSKWPHSPINFFPPANWAPYYDEKLDKLFWAFGPNVTAYDFIDGKQYPVNTFSNRAPAELVYNAYNYRKAQFYYYNFVGSQSIWYQGLNVRSGEFGQYTHAGAIFYDTLGEIFVDAVRDRVLYFSKRFKNYGIVSVRVNKDGSSGTAFTWDTAIPVSTEEWPEVSDISWVPRLGSFFVTFGNAEGYFLGQYDLDDFEEILTTPIDNPVHQIVDCALEE